MNFELRWYADGASNLLIEVWDSSASVIAPLNFSVMNPPTTAP